jgi:P2-related tail formation protein
VSLYDLLPPNATALERDFSRAVSSLQRAGGPLPIVRTAKRVDIPDSVLPWLIFEYGLGEILPYLGDNQRLALAEGVLWQRIRGTPDAVRIALGWIGVSGLIDESEAGSYRWAEYQLGLEEATSGEEIIDNIVGVSRISSPVRSRLQRIYAVYDIRQLVWDQGLLDDGMWDDHSGVRPNPNWPQISYGKIHSSQVEENTTVTSAHTSCHATLVTVWNHFRLDQSIWDEDRDILNHPAIVTTQEGLGTRYEGQTWGAFAWRPEAWNAINVVISCEVTTSGHGAGVEYLLPAGTGAFSLTGRAAGLQVAVRMVAETGGFTTTAQDAMLLKGFGLVAAAATFTLTGRDADLRATRVLTAGTGAFTLTGRDADLFVMLPASDYWSSWVEQNYNADADWSVDWWAT